MARTVMFSTKALRTAAAVGALAAAAGGLAGCVIPQTNLSPDFGSALHQNMVAQLADPDAVYRGPPPPTDGARAGLAMKRYREGKVIMPVPATATDIGVSLLGAPPQ
jgi:hypothetical protein